MRARQRLRRGQPKVLGGRQEEVERERWEHIHLVPVGRGGLSLGRDRQQIEVPVLQPRPGNELEPRPHRDIHHQVAGADLLVGGIPPAVGVGEEGERRRIHVGGIEHALRGRRALRIVQPDVDEVVGPGVGFPVSRSKGATELHEGRVRQLADGQPVVAGEVPRVLDEVRECPGGEAGLARPGLRYDAIHAWA